MRLLLVRHGQSMGNVDKSVHEHIADHAIDLSPIGREQALVAGDVINRFFTERYVNKPKPNIRLWTSPYSRTEQTADGVELRAGAWFSAGRRQSVLIREQEFGLFDGVTDEQLPHVFPKEHAFYDKQERFRGRFYARLPLGESRCDVAQRVHQFFGTIHRDHERHGIDDVVIVTHGVTLRAIVMMWCHKTVDWFENEPNPKNCAVRLIEDGQDSGYLFDGYSYERKNR